MEALTIILTQRISRYDLAISDKTSYVIQHQCQRECDEVMTLYFLFNVEVRNVNTKFSLVNFWWRYSSYLTLLYFCCHSYLRAVREIIILHSRWNGCNYGWQDNFPKAYEYNFLRAIILSFLEWEML